MKTSPTPKPVKILAVASGGGHFVQLLRLRPAFEGNDVLYATVREGYREQIEALGARFTCIPDANRWNKLAVLNLSLAVLKLVLKERPQIIISTGAAPGFFAIFFARFVGARTVWIDSIANAEELSMSGKKAGKHADLWLTQWAHLSNENGPQYSGGVI